MASPGATWFVLDALPTRAQIRAMLKNRFTVLLALCLASLITARARAEGTDELMPTIGTASAQGHLGLSASQVVLADIRQPSSEVICVEARANATSVLTATVVDPMGASVGTVMTDGSCLALTGHPAGSYRMTFSGAVHSSYRWDISVCNAGAGACDASVGNPRHIDGRVHAIEWRFTDSPSSCKMPHRAIFASFYARVPLGSLGTGVVELRFDGVYGQAAWSLYGNANGIDGVSPTRSLPEASNSVTPEFRMYVNLPDRNVEAYALPAPAVTDFRLNAGTGSQTCTAIEPGVNTGRFTFTANMPGTYRVMCDLDHDGAFEPTGGDDYVVSGSAVVGTNNVSWDGRFGAGSVVGDHSCIVELSAGEFHYVARDVEHAFPGMRMYQVDSALARSALPMFWDDTEAPALGVDPNPPVLVMNNGETPNDVAPTGGLSSGVYGAAPVANSTVRAGNARGWGVWSASCPGPTGDGLSKGNTNLLDTWTRLRSVRSSMLTMTILARGADCDGTGGTDQQELCVTGTRRCGCDADAHCDDRIACTADVCTAGVCSATPRPVGTMCPTGVCAGAPTNLCIACVDNTPSSTDFGCNATAQHCRSAGAGAPICEICADTAPTGTDVGCSAATPNCVLGSGGRNTCVACLSASDCNDGNPCTTDACSAGSCSNTGLAVGTMGGCGAGLFCSGAPGNQCVPCVDNAATMRDLGCSATLPHCRVTGVATPTCEACIDTAASGADLGCVSPSPYCIPNASGRNGCVACLAISDCDDANACTTDACNPGGACAHASLPAGDRGMCAGVLLCSGAPSDQCVECVNDDTCSSMRSRCDTTRFVCTAPVRISTPRDGTSTMQPAPEITGTGEPGATVTIMVAGQTLTTTVGADGMWRATPSPIRDGEVTAVATQVVGSVTTMATSTFTIDSTTQVEITMPTEGSTTSNARPTIRGTGEVGASVTVTVGDQTLGPVVVDAEGNWSVAVAMPLPNAMYTATATITDDAGNTANSTRHFTVDARTSVMIRSPMTGSFTNDATPEIHGTAAPGASVTVMVGGQTLGPVTAGRDGVWSVTPSELPDGEVTATATATDVDGNTAEDSTTFTIDSGTRVAITSPENGSVLPTSPGQIRGTGEPGASIAVTVDGQTLNTTVEEDGTWAVTPEGLAPGPHTVHASATDTAGNHAETEIMFEVAVGDAGFADAGVMDGGMERGGLSGGGGCAAQPGRNALPSWALLLLGLVLMRRASRR